MATTAPHLDERRLYKALQQQGFDVEPKGSSVKITAPDGEPLHFHSSTFRADGDWNRSQKNAVRILIQHGFDPAASRDTARDERWKLERDRIESEIAEEQEQAATADMEEAARNTMEADRAAAIRDLPDKVREVYERIVAAPGQAPQAYALGPSINDRKRVSRYLVEHLYPLGLVEKSGDKQSARLWLPGQNDQASVPHLRRADARATRSGKPAAGPVRVRHVMPADPLVAYDRTIRKLADHLTATNELIQELVTAHKATHEELVQLRAWKRRIQERLGSVVDAL